MDEKKPMEQEELESQGPPQREPTPKRTRVLALIGAILMILLVFAYTYSLATGKIFDWKIFSW